MFSMPSRIMLRGRGGLICLSQSSKSVLNRALETPVDREIFMAAKSVCCLCDDLAGRNRRMIDQRRIEKDRESAAVTENTACPSA